MKLAIIGDFNPQSETHLATNKAIQHSKQLLQCDLDSQWINTNKITKNTISTFRGFLIAPGGPYNNIENAIKTIQFARENKIPCLGTCSGFQHIIIEYARNVLGYKNAQHEEYNQQSSELFITKLRCSLKGREMKIKFEPNSKVSLLYGKKKVIEKYYCNYGINPKFLKIIKNGPIKIVGSDHEGEIRVVEYSEHQFFIGTLYVPQVLSTSNSPHPLITGFLNAIISERLII
ncbi:MAG: CTP synthase [Promethearchaeota archaeon]